MATFTSAPARFGFLRIKDMPPRGGDTVSAIITGSEVPGGAITLTKVGGATWLTVPATCTNAVAFNVAINRANLPPEDVYKPVRRTEILRASYAGFDNLDIPVEVVVAPGGPPG